MLVVVLQIELGVDVVERGVQTVDISALRQLPRALGNRISRVREALPAVPSLPHQLSEAIRIQLSLHIGAVHLHEEPLLRGADVEEDLVVGVGQHEAALQAGIADVLRNALVRIHRGALWQLLLLVLCLVHGQHDGVVPAVGVLLEEGVYLELGLGLPDIVLQLPLLFPALPLHLLRALDEAREEEEEDQRACHREDEVKDGLRHASHLARLVAPLLSKAKAQGAELDRSEANPKPREGFARLLPPHKVHLRLARSTCFASAGLRERELRAERLR
mmetsp:Transcript_12728/g.46997  ORF Transcript_12728/g.46997 Transcript_12728/m.46997 type:complete len:275 (-) Transcript_12728:21-845(-)